MDEVRNIIARLRTRVKGIAADRARLENALNRAQSERDRLREDKSRLEERVEELERRIRVLELSSGISEASGGYRPARDRVNKLLREIDRCIALMNR